MLKIKFREFMLLLEPPCLLKIFCLLILMYKEILAQDPLLQPIRTLWLIKNKIIFLNIQIFRGEILCTDLFQIVEWDLVLEEKLFQWKKINKLNKYWKSISKVKFKKLNRMREEEPVSNLIINWLLLTPTINLKIIKSIKMNIYIKTKK